MAATKPRLRFPETVAAGEIIEIKALITHVMETGNRKDQDGNRIPRNIIHTFTARFNGEVVFKAEFGPGISSNPYLAFHLRVDAPGELVVSWRDDDDGETIERYAINVA